MDATTTQARISSLEAELATERARVAKLTEERDLLRASHDRLRLELELLRRRIFVAKAERVDTAQLEMEFAAKLAALDRLGGGPPAAVALATDPGPRDASRQGAATCAT